jgi:hypothetical protein
VGLIERLFGAATPTHTAPKATYTPDELEILAKLRQCRPRTRRALRTLVVDAAAANGIDLDSAKRA